MSRVYGATVVSLKATFTYVLVKVLSLHLRPNVAYKSGGDMIFDQPAVFPREDRGRRVLVKPSKWKYQRRETPRGARLATRTHDDDLNGTFS